MSRKYGGTSLGLAISSRLVEIMGGRVWVKRQEGRGTTFHFTIAANRDVLLEPGALVNAHAHAGSPPSNFRRMPERPPGYAIIRGCLA